MIDTSPASQGSSVAPRAFRLNALLVVISLGWAAFAIQHILTGMHKMALIDAWAVAATLAVRWWSLRSGESKRLDVGGHLAMIVSSLGIVGVSMLSGQAEAMATWYLTAIPLFAAYHLGSRAAVAWAAIVSVLILSVYFSGSFVRFEPEYVPGVDTWLIGKFVLLGVLLGLSIATRRAMDAYVEALAQRESVIRERASELADAHDDALEAVRVKNEFLANMSHEIRTPLNGIIGMTSVLLDSTESEEQLEMVRTIERSSTALLGILNEILDFSKLEADAVQLETMPIDVRECVEDVIDLFARSADDKGIDLYAVIPKSVPQWIEGDVTSLRQVLLNLVGNAIKFTDEGEVFIEVTPESDEMLHFEVVDTGIGIPPEKHGLLFRSFSQVDASTTRHYGGTGLGLAISRRLVDLMGGEIWVRSEPGEGSVFHFTISAPLAESPPETATAPPPRRLFDRHLADRLEARILVAEDNPVNRRVATAVLDRLGYDADVAADGEQVLEALETERYDILFLDLQMPGMDGLQTAEAIRSAGDDELWIVALTASVSPEQQAQAFESGMNDFIGKPFDVDRLVATIVRWGEEGKPSWNANDVGAFDDSSPGDRWGELQQAFVEAPDRLAELIEQHLSNGASLVRRVEENCANVELDEVESLAHSLKSSAAQFGSEDVAQLASGLQDFALRGEPEEVERQVRELARAWSSAERRLRRELAALREESAPDGL